MDNNNSKKQNNKKINEKSNKRSNEKSNERSNEENITDNIKNEFDDIEGLEETNIENILKKQKMRQGNDTSKIVQDLEEDAEIDVKTKKFGNELTDDDLELTL